MTDKVLILTTAGTEAEARKIAESLVDRRLAACVNIISRIQSVYRWEGKVESAEEFLLLIKTTKARAGEVQQAMQELHSYDLPEFVVILMEDGRPDYLAWIGDSVK